MIWIIVKHMSFFVPDLSGKNDFYTHRKRSLGGWRRLYRNQLYRPSICPCVCARTIRVRYICILWINIGSFYIKQILHITLSQGHLGIRQGQKKCKIRVRFIFFLSRNIGLSYFTLRMVLTWGYVIIFDQGHLGKVNLTGRKSAKFVSGPCLNMEKYWKFLTSHKYCL